MRMSKIAILGLVSIVLVSIIITRIASVLSISYSFTSDHEESEKRPVSSVEIGDSADRVFWFLQISDIHLSIFNDPLRIQQFREFCSQTVPVIAPSVVLASGDLADAKTTDMIGSRQFVEEWEYYGGILEDTKVVDKTLWLDIRGNHDNFNVPGANSSTSYFHKYSVQGKKHLRSYMYKLTKGTDTYSFIAVDACLEPGPRRPFNFIGSLSHEDFQALEQFELDSRPSTGTIWFGHYPTSCILTPKDKPQGLRKLMGHHGVAYMCGHLHTLAGLVPNMYTLQQSGILELELGDWKDNRLFRLAAFDHGLFSFTDLSHNTWPAVLVTSPKQALFSLPHKEPLVNSTHIRLLAFSLAPIQTVQVKLPGGEVLDATHVKGPLFVAPWDPSLYNTGLHSLTVTVKDEEGREQQVQHSFSFDGSRESFRFLPRVTLMTDATTIFYSAFVALVAVSVLPLLFLRILHTLIRNERIAKPDFADMPFKPLIRKLWILSTIDKLYYPLVLYPIYLTLGPWFIGEIIDGYIGAAFAWGTWVKGTILPGAFSYFYGCIQLFWFHIPFTLVVSHCVDYRFRLVCYPDLSGCSYMTKVLMNNIPCLLVLFTQALFAYYFWLAYGTMALFLGPLRTWSVLLGAYLWYSSATLQAHHLLQARFIWGNKDYYHFTGEPVKEESQHAL